MLTSSLYTDSLTGFPNLFALIMADIHAICEQSGAVLYMDTKSLMHVNTRYGHEMGDLYIAACAGSIKSAVASRGQDRDRIHVYRISGDDFIVIFPGQCLQDISRIPESIDGDMKAFALERSLDFSAGIHFVSWEYAQPPASPSALVRTCYLRMQEEFSQTPLPLWVDHLINQMYGHIEETLTLLEKTSQEALIDSVSQLPNNRAARQSLLQVQREYDLSIKPFSVLFIDGDNLRRFNDISYENGNEMIRELGKLIKSSIRESDSLFRWLSGDEFLVILPNTEKKAAYKLAERIRTAVSSVSAAWEFPVTVSIGVACYPADGATVEQVLSVAEKGNSSAKKDGKNTVR